MSQLSAMYSLGGVTFLLFLSTLIGAPVLPQLARELGASEAEVPMVLAAALATGVTAQFFTGFLADRYPRCTLILIGAALGSLTSLLCVVAADWKQLLALRILGGLADAVSLPALLAITATLSQGRTGAFFGILRMSQGLAYMVGPALGSLLSLVSLRAPFLVDGALSLVALVAARYLIRDEERAQAPHSLNCFKSLGRVMRQGKMWLFLLLGVSALLPFGILQSFLPAKAQALGLPPWQIGTILSLGALVFSVVSLATGFLSDRIGRRRLAILSQPVILLSLAGLGWSDRFPSFLVFYSLFSVAETAAFLLCFVYAAEACDREIIGTAMGAFDSLLDLSLLLGPALAIALFQASGNMAWTFVLAGIPAAGMLFAAGYSGTKKIL